MISGSYPFIRECIKRIKKYVQELTDKTNLWLSICNITKIKFLRKIISLNINSQISISKIIIRITDKNLLFVWYHFCATIFLVTKGAMIYDKIKENFNISNIISCCFFM